MFQPTRLDNDLRIEFWYVRFDVEQWSAVDHVHILDVQHTFLNSVQSHNRKADGIRPLGGAGGEDSTWLRIQERHDVRSESPAVVKVIQQDDVGETIKILQTGTVLLKHLHGALYAGPAHRLNWHALGFCERRVDHANWLEFNLHHLSREHIFYCLLQYSALI